MLKKYSSVFLIATLLLSAVVWGAGAYQAKADDVTVSNQGDFCNALFFLYDNAAIIAPDDQFSGGPYQYQQLIINIAVAAGCDW